MINILFNMSRHIIVTEYISLDEMKINNARE